MRKIISALLVVSILAAAFSNLMVSADNPNAAETEIATETDESSYEDMSYQDYLSALNQSDFEDELEIELTPENTKLLSGDVSFNDTAESKGLQFSEEEAAAEISFYTEEAISGYLKLEYTPDTESQYISSSIGVQVNGEYPFDESREMELSWRWCRGETTTDERGNEILGTMEGIPESTTSLLWDPSGRWDQPLVYSFQSGENTLTVLAHTGNFTLHSVTVVGAAEAESYADTAADYQSAGYQPAENQSILLEAEDYTETSSSMLSPDYDKENAATSPNHPSVLLYNMISGDKYTQSGQWLMWEFTPEQTGLYYISMRARQDEKSGFSVSRRLLINDQEVFRECAEISFPYSSDWYVQTLGGDTPYAFYFEAGKTYQIKLMVTPGSLAAVTTELDDLIYELNSLYRSVIMIAGTDPDTYRDYQLSKVIPGFTETVADLKQRMEQVLEILEERNQGRSGSSLSAFHSLINRLEKIQEDPDLLARTASSFKSDIQSLSSWNQDAKEQPLDLDCILIHSPDVEPPEANAGFFEGLWFKIQRVVASFMADYGVVGQIYEGDDSLDVWISTGRDQMNIIKRLIDNSFSAQYGINVNVSLVTVDIRTAVLAGTAPDVSLFLASDMPVNLALRGAVEDLSNYEGFEEVVSRFSEGTMTPFAYQDGYYALPLTETFNMMFVRTDIFEELELEIPQTWDEFYHVATVLQRNNLEVGIPSNIGMFATLLLQYGGEFYNSQLTNTMFDSDAAITAFEMWTGLFSRYGFPLTFDFYNRFSSGEMPLAIADYALFLQVEAASPELSGRWQMVPIPGVEQDDGTIDRTISISSATGTTTSPGLAQSITCGVIFSQSDNLEGAWKFLDWFTSDEIQTEYGRGIESALGSISRYTPANSAAFNNMAWSREELLLLNEQKNNVRTLNEISGNYSVTRELVNAFRRVVYDNANPTDTIYTYNKRINRELERKQEINNG